MTQGGNQMAGIYGSYFNYSSSLFTSSSSSSGASGLLGEYMSIRNGSYKKLLGAYYAKQAKATGADKKASSDKTETKAVKAETTQLDRMKTDASSLKSAADNLTVRNSKLFEPVTKTVKDEQGNETTVTEPDRDAISKAVNAFAKAYNATLDSAAKQDNIFTLRKASMMTKSTSTNQRMLNRVGITVGQDNKLSVDEEKLRSADLNDLKTLFSGSSSYGASIGQRASDIAKISEQLIKSANNTNASTYTNTGKYSALSTGTLYDSLF